MTVERRYSNRHPVDFEVEIRYRRRRFPSGRALNLSQEGIFLETRNLTLPRGTMLDLEIRRWGREWLIPAIVVHGNSRGVGLMFREAQPDLYDLEVEAPTEPRKRYRTTRTPPSHAGL